MALYVLEGGSVQKWTATAALNRSAVEGPREARTWRVARLRRIDDFLSLEDRITERVQRRKLLPHRRG